MTFLSNIGLAAFVFVGTNLDNLMLLLMFFADRRFTPRQVILGNYIGGLILILGGLVCGLAACNLPALYFGWLGIVPLTLGCWQLMALVRRKSRGIFKPRAVKGKQLNTSCKPRATR